METNSKQLNFYEGDDALLGGFVTSAKAKQLLCVKNTTLYYLRKKNELVYSRVGSKIFYELDSIKELLNRNKRGGI